MRLFKTIKDMKAALGQELGPGDWFKIDQERVDAFAEITCDDQWIHVDVERAAREMPDGRTIAHGFLTLSLIPHLRRGLWRLESVAHGINYGVDKVRFPAPVMVGDRVRLRQTLHALEPQGDGHRLTSRCTVEVEGGDKPACVAEMVGLLYERL